MDVGRLTCVIILIALALPVTPVITITPSYAESQEVITPRVTDNATDLIVPAGEVYELCGCHTYARSIVINGTLKVKPYNGTNGTSGTLTLISKSILVGIDGIIMADGRGYGGGGGASENRYEGTSAGGASGSGGPGGSAYPYSYSGGGGGGSNGGSGGIGGSLGGGNGANGNEDHGGNGGDKSQGGGYFGEGGQGYGGGGGGGGGTDGDLGAHCSGPGGGGGGGSGGSSPVFVGNPLGQIGGHGAGLAGGEGGDNITYPWPCDGCNGGYHVAGANGDNTTDASIDMGSGGGGGGKLDKGCAGGSGGGGAGGGSVALISDGNLIIEGSITAIGGGGGSGGRAPSWYISGGNGGGGGGGGVLLYGKEVLVPGRVDVRGREGNGISSVNGGTVKIFYETNMTYGTIRAGRLYSNGRPLMQGLEHPLDNGSSLLRPEFRWWSAIDPEGDNISYQIQVAIWPDFKMPLVDIDGLRLYNFAPADDLLGKEFFWRVRATDAIGYGNWSETRRFHNDISAPVTSIDPLPVYVNRTSFLVSWTGSDDVTGIAKYRIYVAEGKSPFRVWLYDVNYTSAVYEGAKEGFKYSFFSEGIDRAGNNESARMTADACTTVDCTPPVSSVDSVSYGDAPGEIVVRWSGSDSTSGIREYNVFISEDGETFNVWQLATTDTSAPFLGGDALEYSFYCTACDNAGNVENATDGTRILKLRADRSAPVTALSLTGTSFGQEPVYVALSTMFILSAADNCSGVKETWFALDDGKPKPFLSSFTSKSPGIHSLGYWSVDIAGNAEKTNKMEFFVDDEAPETTVDVGGPNLSATGKIFLSGNCSIILLANDNASGVARTEYNLDNHGYMEYVRLFGLDMAGKHTLLYRSVDNVGNMEVDQSVQIVVDIQPPTTKAVTDALLSNVDIRILFNANDSESGVMCTYYRITREKLPFGEYQTGNEAVILAEEDHSSDANYSIQYYSVDKLGNKETAREFKVRIDTQVFLQLGFKGVPKVGIDRYSIQGRTEPGARMSINDEVVFLSSDGGFTYDVGLRPGRNKATITIIDLAGNTLTRTVNIDYEQRVDTTGWWIVAIAIAVVTGIITIAGVFVAKRAKRNIKLKKRRRLKHSSMQSKTRGNNKPKINRSP